MLFQNHLRSFQTPFVSFKPDVSQFLYDPDQQDLNGLDVSATAFKVILDLHHDFKLKLSSLLVSTTDINRYTLGSVPLVLSTNGVNKRGFAKEKITDRVVKTNFIPCLFSALNCIMCPEERGREGLYVGGLVLS